MSLAVVREGLEKVTYRGGSSCLAVRYQGLDETEERADVRVDSASAGSKQLTKMERTKRRTDARAGSA